MTLARRFEPVIQRTWTLHAKDRLEYADFVEKVLDELFADVEHLRSARAFPFLFMTILQRVVDNASSTGAGLVSPPQPDSGQRSTGLDPAIVDVLLVQAYIDRLAPRTRMALELEFVEGLSREEIMERMELTLSGVVTARKRGLQTLRVILQKEAKGLRSAERYTRKPRQR
jgi:DNA-directed RNA polymerase specialized sigma24 family protein